VPTPVPQAVPGGEPFVRWQGEFVSLFPWVAGRTLARAELTPGHAAAVGSALARLHLASEGFSDHRPGRYEPFEIGSRLAKIILRNRPELASAVAVLGPEMTQLGPERAGELPMGVIHGDLFVDNVLYDEAGTLTALIDFEQASWGRLAYDLAVTTLAFGYGRDDFRPEIVRALIEAYVAARPAARAITDAERAAFGAELRFVACRFAITRITDVHLKREAGGAPGKNYQRYLDRLTSVKTHLAAGDGLFDL
jgi:homoserine kinase type II